MERTSTARWHHALLCSLIYLMVLGVGTALGGVASTPRKGGTLRVATLGEPPSLDAHWTTATITQVITYHYLEGLYTQGKDYAPIPMLAEGHTVSDDGLVYTFKLRQGVLFHHGKEMTTEDAVPSIIRWGKMSTYGKGLFKQVESVKAIDRYTFQLHLQEKSAIVLPSLSSANNFSAIYPKEVLDEAGEGQVKTFTGTGPFKIEERKPDRYIKMVRFEPYKSRPEPPNGWGGGKTAWVDTLMFIPTPDVSVRVASVESGEADFTFDATPDAYDRLRNNPDIKVQIAKPYYWLVSILNKKKGLFTNEKLRQAFLAALDMEPIMRATVGRPEFYRHDSSLSFREEQWWTDVGREMYDQKDQEKARRLLKEAGYQGEPLRYMTTQEYDWMYKFALVTKQQLEDVGFKVDLQVVDWATLVQRRNNPDLYDAFTTGIGQFADPTLHVVVSCDWPGWNCDPDFQKLLDMMAIETQFEKRYTLWQEVHKLFWERVPVIRYGDIFALNVMRKNVNGPFDMIRPYFWNVWLEK
jgi:peptide/nickel transport system substrate-binding protein